MPTNIAHGERTAGGVTLLPACLLAADELPAGPAAQALTIHVVRIAQAAIYFASRGISWRPDENDE